MATERRNKGGAGKVKNAKREDVPTSTSNDVYLMLPSAVEANGQIQDRDKILLINPVHASKIVVADPFEYIQAAFPNDNVALTQRLKSEYGVASHPTELNQIVKGKLAAIAQHYVNQIQEKGLEGEIEKLLRSPTSPISRIVKLPKGASYRIKLIGRFEAERDTSENVVMAGDAPLAKDPTSEDQGYNGNLIASCQTYVSKNHLALMHVADAEEAASRGVQSVQERLRNGSFHVIYDNNSTEGSDFGRYNSTTDKPGELAAPLSPTCVVALGNIGNDASFFADRKGEGIGTITQAIGSGQKDYVLANRAGMGFYVGLGSAKSPDRVVIPIRVMPHQVKQAQK